MKKFLGLLICVLTVVLIGCQNPANNDTGNQNAQNNIKCTDIQLSPMSRNLVEGEQIQLSYVLTPSNANVDLEIVGTNGWESCFSIDNTYRKVSR